MKKMLVVSLLLSSLPLMAQDDDYKHCASTFNSFDYETNNFAKLDSKGEFVITPGSSSMEIKGNKLVYKSLNSTTVKGLISKKEKTVETDKEIFEIEYESIVDGKPVGKIKKVSYRMENLKDIENKKPGAVDISFDYKNGQCIPQVTKYDGSAGLSSGLKLMFKGMTKMDDLGERGAKDLYKCKELQDYMKDIKDLEACRNSENRLSRLEQLTNNVDAKIGKKADEVSKKKAEKATTRYYDVIRNASFASLNCSQSGYMEILNDDEYWKKVNAPTATVDDTAKVQAK